MKPLPQLIQNLVHAAAGEGNYLLNVGPKPDGSIRPEERSRFAAIGRWLKRNGPAVYGSERCSLSGGMIGEWTRRGNTGYLCIFRWPGSEAVVPLVASKVRSATLLATGAKLRFRQEHNGRLVLSSLPQKAPHPAASVIEVEFADVPRRLDERNRAAWLRPRASPAAD